jgi:hypothetical protein
MKKYFTIFFLCIFCNLSVASETERQRITVKIPSNDESQVSKLLENLKNAVDNEDYNDYTLCLSKQLIKKNKKKMAIMFVEHDLVIELGKFNIVDSSDDKIEFVVKYTLTVGVNSYEVVSNVLAIKENDNLLIAKEEILSKKNSAINNDSSDYSNCVDGKCFKVENQKIENQNLNQILIYKDESGKVIPLDEFGYPENYSPCRKCRKK